jgi:large subunit ribosomal protein L10
MPTQRKIETVADLKQRLERMQVTVVADYRGFRLRI